MTVATFTQPNYLTQSASAYKAALDAAIAVLQTIGGDFAPHAQSTPDMQLVVDAGRIFKPGGAMVSVDQQITGALIAPVSSPRIDRVVVDSESGVYSILTGTEAATPVAPTIPNGKLPVCQISMTVGMTTIANSIITDERTTYGPLAKLMRMPVEQVQSATTGFTREILLADRGILFDCDCSNGPIDIILPDSAQAGNGFMIGVMKSDSVANSVTLVPSTTGEAFNDGSATKQVSVQNGVVIITTDGLGQWYLAFDSSRTYSNVTLTGTVSNTPNGSGTQNTGYGTLALDSLTTANNNTAVGYGALTANNSGGNNTALGSEALSSNVTGASNTAVGANALKANTGAANTAIGGNALLVNTTGGSNVAVGFGALSNNTTGSQNVAIGYLALDSTTSGSNNVSIGYNALTANIDGQSNVAIGQEALNTATTATQSVAIGTGAMQGNTTSGGSVAIGWDALRDGGGSNNTACGQDALYSNSGSNNTGCGLSAGYIVGGVSGSNNSFFGNGATPAAAADSNKITLGNSSITHLRCQVTTITALSDQRDKKEIVDIPLGLSFIQSLKPRQFVWNMRDSAKVDVIDSGFIAQELMEAQAKHNAEWLELVYESNPEKLEATPGKLIPVLVKAIQELKAEFDQYRLEHP